MIDYPELLRTAALAIAALIFFAALLVAFVASQP